MQATTETLGYATSHEVDTSSRLVNCDSLPELAQRRQYFYEEAYGRLQRNYSILDEQGPDAVPLAIDVLGTARTLSHIGYQFGQDSEEYQHGEAGLDLDSARLAAEVMSKNRSEYFPKVFQYRDSISGHYYSNGYNVSDIVVKGLSPLAEDGEQPIRVADFVEHKTKEAIGATNLAAEGISMVTIKPCPDYVIEAYKEDPNKAYGGYVPAIEKMFIQVDSFDNSVCSQEELAFRGTYITPEVVSEVLSEAEAIASGQILTKQEIRSMQLLSSDDDPLIDLMSKLDQKASELSGLKIFLGEEVVVDHPKDYSKLREDALARQESQRPLVEDIKDLLMDYQAVGLDSRVASCKLDGHLKEKLFILALEDPILASQMFDEATAQGIAEAKSIENRGGDSRAYIADVYKNAPQPSYCGAGSCGLEVPHNLAEVAKVRALGLKGDLVHDKERACPQCGQKSIYYGLDGGKACGGCLAYEPAS